MLLVATTVTYSWGEGEVEGASLKKCSGSPGLRGLKPGRNAVGLRDPAGGGVLGYDIHLRFLARSNLTSLSDES